MNTVNKSKICLLTAVCLGVTGFTDFFIKDNPVDEIQQFVSEVKASTPKSPALSGMEPVEIKPYEPYHFTANGNNPFVVKGFVEQSGMDMIATDEDLCATSDCGDGPPTPHAPYFLENYNLDQLSMIGTMNYKGRGRIALIQTPNAGVVRAAQGEYIGRNNGLILSINGNRLVVVEKYRSPKGWQDRKTTLPLLKK